MKLLRNPVFLWLYAAIFAVSIYLSFATPVAGIFRDAATLMMMNVSSKTPVQATIKSVVSSDANRTTFLATDRFEVERKLVAKNSYGLKPGMMVVGDCAYTAGDSSYELVSLERINPSIVFPLIQGLGELGRNILFHVPMSFVAFIAFLLGTINSIQLLRKNDLKYDLRARASSAGGLLYTTLATVTGSIWARFSWGKFWNWDEPRETSILVLLLIYIAYFLLRSLLEDSEEKKARIAAVYNCIAFVTVPFLMFILPRITRSLHPGSGSEAPVVNLSGKTHIDPWFSIFLWVNVTCFAILFLWMRDLYIRTETLEARRAQQYE
ncbi:MAG: cytochrome c biogenesis protein CcsA [Bacteroidetes bacterium]|nr:cytochrome c biogenesis protein CcsA [Bacteroidota bacterium]